MEFSSPMKPRSNTEEIDDNDDKPRSGSFSSVVIVNDHKETDLSSQISSSSGTPSRTNVVVPLRVPVASSVRPLGTSAKSISSLEDLASIVIEQGKEIESLKEVRYGLEFEKMSRKKKKI